VENTLYRNSEQQYVDIIGDARKRPELKNGQLKFTPDQVLSFSGATTVDAPRQIYEAPIDEYFGSIKPVMPKTNAANTVQGRAAATVPWITYSQGTVETTDFSQDTSAGQAHPPSPMPVAQTSLDLTESQYEAVMALVQRMRTSGLYGL
jgi:hypothetical protein